MFILMVTPGMGGSWLPVTPPRYDHLTLSRSMSGLTAGLGALSLTSWLLDRRTATECRMLELRWEL